MAIDLKNMKPNVYSLGLRKAYVRRRAEMPDWASWPNSTELMNCAFLLYFRAAQNIGATGDAALQRRMTAILEDCATEGWGSGVSDLDEAFEHLVGSDDHWLDGNSDTYLPVRYSFAFPNHLSFRPIRCTSAESCVNFLNEMENVASGVLAKGEDLMPQMDRLEHALNASRWDTVSDVCTTVGLGFEAGEMADVALLAAVTPEAPVPSLWEVLDGVSSGMRNYEALRSRGVNATSAEAIGVLSAVTALVPVFGWYFEKALEYCPALVDVVQGWARKREMVLAAAEREMQRAPCRGVRCAVTR